MKKRIALFLALIMLTGMVSAASAAWENSGGGWWYSYENGGYARNEWINDGAWYYFDDAGWMVTGWKQIGGAWYYFDGGAMKTGWLQQGDAWYYFGADGAMVTGTAVIDGTEYTFSSDGVWQDTAPAGQTGWVNRDGAWYYYETDGSMATGWKQFGENWSFFSADGVLATGWLKDGSAWYFFNADGVMQTGWLQQDGNWYYLGTGGAMVTGAAVIDGTEYTFDANGVWQEIAKTGWSEADGGYVYILDDGERATGWKEIKGTWYYFNENGLMKTGWLQYGEDWYYFAVNGAMATGEVAIDGILYTFDDSGVMTGSKELNSVDFEGKTIYIYDWWTGTNWDEENYDELTDEGKALYDYRKELEKKYNCKIVTNAGSGNGYSWGECGDKIKDFVANGGQKDSYVIFIIEPGQIGSLITGGAAAPWSYDLSGDKWNKADMDLATIKGKVYGVSPYKSEPRGMLFFNKRVLTEAGIDWNTIYDLQKSGSWTWDAFEKILKEVTRDTDNDGVNDINGLVGSSDTFYMTAVFANGGNFFDYDKNDQLQPAMGSAAAVSALEWAQGIKEKYWAVQPEDSSWDWYMEAWQEGKTAFYAGQSYEGFNGTYTTVGGMEDDWGAVAFPTATASGKYKTSVTDNLTVIPSVYDSETVAALAEVYDAFTNPAPGYEDGGLPGSYYELTDERAVEETYGMLQESEHGIADKSSLLGNVNTVLGPDLLWRLGGSLVSEIIEEGMSFWQGLCDAFNTMVAQMK